MAWVLAVAVFQALPAPTPGDAQHAVGQSAEVVGHLFHGQHVLHVAREGAEHLGVVGAAQQVEQGFLVVFSACGQGLAARFQFGLELLRVEAFFVELLAGQLVDHAGMFEQVARGPFGGTEHMQQTLVYRGAFL